MGTISNNKQVMLPKGVGLLKIFPYINDIDFPYLCIDSVGSASYFQNEASEFNRGLLYFLPNL